VGSLRRARRVVRLDLLAGIRLETIAEGRVDWEDLTGQEVYSVNQLGKAQFLQDRVDPDFRVAMHIDTDEANAANLKTGLQGYLDGIQSQD